LALILMVFCYEIWMTIQCVSSEVGIQYMIHTWLNVHPGAK
jgi:hypothetical protein